MSLSGFHPTVARWFSDTLGSPTRPQRDGWPSIRAGRHTLIAAPTGSGKTLSAFLHGIDSLLRRGEDLPDTTQIVYVSPLKALGNDVQKNLLHPLQELRALDASLPEVRVMVRSGDTPQSERRKMLRKPPHILVTTPESLYILLTTVQGREMLRHTRQVIVDEIHALARDKRGSHLALTLERLTQLVEQTDDPSDAEGTDPADPLDLQQGELQRIGLSATQNPIEDTARLLVGTNRQCSIIDCGHLRALDLAVCVPSTPLQTVCSSETWEEIFASMVTEIEAHRTTLVFVNTRKMAERTAARLAVRLGDDQVTSHHGSLSRERRLDAEKRLKAGELRALVATSSLELGIDVGDIDLVIQAGPTATIAMFLQRVGRAGHGPDRVPKGRLFPFTREELVTSAALLRSVRTKQLDRTVQPEQPLDILAQQIIASCVTDTWSEDALFQLCCDAAPYAALTREAFDACLTLHTQGRRALLHRDGVHGTVRGTKRSRLSAILSGGAIADNANYRVVLQPDEVTIGSVDEDFAVEASVGDVFQLGNASWRVLKVESGLMRVSDAQGSPPSLPFWFGESPARSAELSGVVSEVRTHGKDPRWLVDECGLRDEAAAQVTEFLTNGEAALGTMPVQGRLVLERFFDETGGMQLVLHSVYGGRINRALGLALRKRFCKSFGFELQAAATEEHVLISLGPMHSFELNEVYRYLHPDTVEDVLLQAMLPAPMFQTRWRWNATRSLMVDRMVPGGRVPAPLLRMRVDDALVEAFPAVQACPETLPPGPIEIPRDHPIVGQTVHDCLTEVMDIDGLRALLHGIRDGSIETVAIDTAAPSSLAESVLHAMPWAFLDDAPLEERRTQAVISRQRGARVETAEDSHLDPEATAAVREECWPHPTSAEEVHETLCWFGFVRTKEAPDWRPWLESLQADGRVEQVDDRWLAIESTRDPVELLRMRMEGLGPVRDADLTADERTAMIQLESEGVVLRATLPGAESVDQVWCNRRLLARIRRRMVERLRKEIRPVSAGVFARFLGRWQHVTEGYRLTGPRGLAQVLEQLAGFEVPGLAWESDVLPARVDGYRREWLDELTLSGEFVWCRLFRSGRGPLSGAAITFVPRRHLRKFTAIAAARGDQLETRDPLRGPASTLQELLVARGPEFPEELRDAARLIPSEFEAGLSELIGTGHATCDSFAAMRQLMIAPSKRRFPIHAVGRWSLLPTAGSDTPQGNEQSVIDPGSDEAEYVARLYLARYGVVFYRLLERERIPTPWRDVLRALRTLELRGEVRGGRFVGGFAGEQFAKTEAIALLRRTAREGGEAISVAAADPLNMGGVLDAAPRTSTRARESVLLG